MMLKAIELAKMQKRVSVTEIDKYSKKKIQVYHGEVPKILERYMREHDWNTFLDIGCGDGVLLHSLYRIGMLNGRVCRAVDLSRTRIDRAALVNPFAHFNVDDACNLKTIKNSVIDFATSMQVIEHVESDEKSVAEISRVLRPGGIAYIETIFKKTWAWYFYKCNGKHVLEPNHVREYTEDDQLVPILERYGLEIVEAHKELLRFSLIDVIGHKTRLIRDTSTGIINVLRRVKVPIPGYYNWKIICIKKS